MTNLDPSGFEYGGFNEALYDAASARELRRYCRFLIKKIGRAAGRRLQRR